MEYSPEQLQKRYTELPQVLQEALSSTDVAQKVESIAKKYRLLIPQAGDLSDEIGLVLMGLSSPGSFSETIQRKLNINSVLAKEITEEINQSVFQKVRSYLIEHTERQNPEIKESEDREELLREIEQPHSPTQNVPPVPKPQPPVPPNLPGAAQEQEITIIPGTHPFTTIKLSSPSPVTPPTAAQPKPASFIDQKLAAPVNTVQEQKEIIRTSVPSQPKYKVDPYREPLA
jgi:hypothetical protein